jgi:predicted dinucleotide-binding enzyme
MATAVIGAGSIGKTLAGLLSKAGEPVEKTLGKGCYVEGFATAGHWEMVGVVTRGPG